MTPKTNSTPGNVRWQIATYLWQAVRAHGWRVVIALALLLAAKLASVSVPVLLKRIVDELGTPTPAMLPVFLILGYAIVRFLSNAFNEVRDVAFSEVTQRTVADLTVKTFSHLHHLSARFHAQRETGAVIRDMEKGTTAVGFLLGVSLFAIVPTVVEIAMILAIIVRNYGGGFLAIIAVTFLSYAAWTAYATRRRMRMQKQVNALEAVQSSRIVDSLLNADTVKYFARESFETERLRVVADDWAKAGVANQSALSALHIGQSACIGAGIAAVMLLAGQHVMTRAMTIGDLVLINAYIIQVSLPLNSLGFVFRETNDAISNIERLFALLFARGRPDEDNDARDARALVVTGGAIEFSGVDFSYEPGRQLLHDVSFRVGSGQTVAIVGGSGSGKSTLARLLFRLYQPDAGTIRIDGQDLREVTQQSVRDAIGIVPQDTILFNDTLAYNIAYGRPGATRADVVKAARSAQLAPFIEALPDAYETRVGERGMRLSGGERQRIAIARALLKRPPIIVFDEATSALDTRTERAIQVEMMQLAEQRTSLLIAHRLSTVVGADWILVMDRGRIVEQGRHDDLLARGSVYAQLWHLQEQQRELEQVERRVVMRPVRLVPFVEGVLDALREPLLEHRTELNREMATDDPVVTIDAPGMHHLLWEILRFAVEMTGQGGRLDVRVMHGATEAAIVLGSPLFDAPELSLLDFTAIQASLEQHGAYLTRTHDDEGVTLRITLPLAVQGPGGEHDPPASPSGEPHADTHATPQHPSEPHRL
ncbi:ATP-binding cassette domain-containing protein [Pandoraea nosoerga]|uniref:ABC transporter ATP-binding protein n=1 Tax=Pandoraea nosoerga TaxID=2508296 RepID=A0A5E4SNX3_9BURK|nr:ABC transporter ATP-binding protein/permease [Pandoraea nosoerga]MBN4665225.1 ATP-binding cassette domain-containing protein [Pandoraea nosoerga]MBN4674626.1 ATP-binding cassette domain-containing protein [Pandoraea nosoerga]MBN4680514.1 ATP-binding cassette domain-containing protein [Pandoraea nosoerga]MBN4743919.1 ATP-binding cassette domain-containing protein [Pandoraea nosoerga]VVD76593.1 ABC transporter ATP-binding protein [Pandoraea nosoerga]